MQRNPSIFLSAFLVFALAVTIPALNVSAFSQTENTLYNFTGGSDGGTPYGGRLIFDPSGNLYGIAIFGGINDNGVIYELSPAAGGGWTQTVLYSFLGGSDGSNPEGALVFDSLGNLYGGTYAGGTHGQGTIFELSPVSGGGWTEKILYNFAGGTDGANSNGSLTFGPDGSLYGTTVLGGINGMGTVFQLSPATGGTWTETVLFTCSQAVGGEPHGDVVFDSKGNFYTALINDGPFNAGAILRLKLVDGTWRTGLIYSFKDDANGGFPLGDLAITPQGRLYGAVETGGSHDLGAIFALEPQAGGSVWKETIVHSFGGKGDGRYSAASLSVVLDAAGDLYGVTDAGGTTRYGVAYKLTPDTGVMKETILYTFNKTIGQPIADPVLDSFGNLYGPASLGTDGFGDVYEIIQ
jgi:uncharacterized repeat protein (TIGR03803 family)